MYKKVIDRFNEFNCFCFCSYSFKFLLLSEKSNDDSIKLFFNRVYDILVKVSNDLKKQLLNPFFKLNKPIQDASFNEKIKKLYLLL